MDNQHVADMKLYCKMSVKTRYSKCFNKECKKSSSDPANIAECQYGCGWWEDGEDGEE